MVRRLISGLLVSAVTFAILLLALELGLRLAGVGDDAVSQPHPWAGWAHIPGRRASVHSEDPHLARRIVIAIDSLGLRDVERQAHKPPGVYRILVLGDSFVEAVQVPLESTFTRRLERALDGRSGHRVEVWNCGISGYTTSQELLYLRHVAYRFHPDLVVLCFLSGNDVPDQVPVLATSLRNRPFFHLRGDQLVLDRSFFRSDPPLVGWLRTHSRAFMWANTRRQVAFMNMRARAAEGHGAGIPQAFQLYAEHPDSSWSLGWDLTDRLILATRDEAARQSAAFLLVSISSGVQEHPAARTRWIGWDQWKDRPGISLDLPERRLARLSSENGIDYLPLLPVFRLEQARTGRPLHIGWASHWNAEGHAVAARALVDRLAGYIERGAR